MSETRKHELSQAALAMACHLDSPNVKVANYRVNDFFEAGYMLELLKDTGTAVARRVDNYVTVTLTKKQ